MKHKVIMFIKILLVIICMITIFMFSSDDSVQSTKKSDGVIINLVSGIYNRDLSKSEIKYYTNKLIVPVRKSAHFLIYLVLGIVVCNLICEFTNIPKKLIFISLLICFLYACSDEIHQLFVPGRSGQIKDALIDTSGSLCGIVSYYLIRFKLFRRRNYE